MTPFLLLVLYSAFSPVGTGQLFRAGRVADAPSSSQVVETHAMHRIETRSWSTARADTLRAGETFIANLPDSLSNQPVGHYQGVALPGRSWLLERSFFWKTADRDKGDHEFWFRAFLADERVDSLSIRVTVE